jgi:hypothetical protein
VPKGAKKQKSENPDPEKEKKKAEDADQSVKLTKEEMKDRKKIAEDLRVSKRRYQLIRAFLWVKLLLIIILN